MDPVMTPDQAFQMLMNVLIAIGVGYASSPVTTLLVNLSKVLPFLSGFSGQVLQSVWAVLLTVLTWIGYATLTQVQVDNLTQFMGVIATALLQLFFNSQGAATIHAAAAAKGNHMFGYKRS